MMIKNAWLSIRKNIGKSILLFGIMLIIANLVMAGLSIQSASEKSMDQIRSSLGNDVTLSVDMRQMMKNREMGQSLQEVQSSITSDMADSLIQLDHVEDYNYTISSSANSDDIVPIETEQSDEGMTMPEGGGQGGGMGQFNIGDFVISANSTMKYIEEFTSGNYSLIEGALLSSKDKDSSHCVIETNVAEENSLSIGSTFTIYTTIDNETISQELEVVGIYEIETTTSSQGMRGMMFTNPVNTIYTDISIGYTLTNDTTTISSATYYLDDPENMDSFITDAKENTEIDFEMYTLDANDQLYQRNISSLVNTESFATMFLLVVVIAGSVILGLILILTIRNRFHEIGIFLSLGQSKVKIIGQQVIEIGIVACVAFVISLGTGRMVSNMVSGMLINNQSNDTVQMEMGNGMPGGPGGNIDEGSGSDSFSERRGGPNFSDAFSTPIDEELDVSLTINTVMELGVITLVICVISTMLPSIYVLRLSPREILMKRAG